jgi:LysR family pca operon transcriptional activator
MVSKMEYKKARRIKMRHLSAFVETVKCGSLKAAAERTFLTQPSISKTLKDLEEIIGAPLLNRDRGGVELTREGAVFMQFAEQSLAALSHGLASLEALDAGEGAPLRIGTLPSVAADLLPEAILAFSELSPSTSVTVEDGPIGALLERLRGGHLDLVIGRMGRPEIMRDFSFTQLYAEQVVFAAAMDHPLITCSDLNDLEGTLILFPPKGAAIRPLIERYLIARGVGKWQNRIETVSGAFGRSMTLGPARAIWIISQGVVARDIAAGRMALLPIDTSDMAGPVGIMARSEEEPTPVIKLFRQALLSCLN